MNIELNQIVISIDGQLNLVRVPKDRHHLALSLLQAIFDDGRILVTPLPPEFQLIPLADVKSPT